MMLVSFVPPPPPRTILRFANLIPPPPPPETILRFAELIRGGFIARTSGIYTDIYILMYIHILIRGGFIARTSGARDVEAVQAVTHKISFRLGVW